MMTSDPTIDLNRTYQRYTSAKAVERVSHKMQIESLLEELRQSNEKLTQSYETTLDGWGRALDLRDHDTEGHTVRVTTLAVRLAKVLGLTGKDLTHIRHGALLHDIGKLGIPDSILLKPGPLNDAEWTVMRMHPLIAYQLLQPMKFLQEALDIPRYHHEKWDGTGYPDGLQGGEIPIVARIFAVVDVWDALQSKRPYHEAQSKQAANAYIFDQAGKHFDPEIALAFLKHCTNQSIDE